MSKPHPRTLDVADGLTVPIPIDVVTQRLFITGNTGSGKTNTAVVIVEELLDHQLPVVILDPMDVWWGLKASRDGRQSGYPLVIFGGNHQDLPLAAGDGATIADMVVDHRISAILSLSRFEEDEDMVRFVTDFARRLVYRKDEPKHRTPLQVVLDEAAMFIPPTPEKGNGAKLMSAIRKISRQGRVLGLGLITIDQRPASVNVNVRNMAELVIAHRLTASHDRDAMEKWVKAKATPDQVKTFMASLASMPQGQAWFWSPEWLGLFEKVGVRLRKTFDSSATPKAGEAIVTPRKLAQADLDTLRPLLAKTIEEARENDPETLKQKILELERQLTARPPSSPPPPAAPPPKPIEVPVILPGDIERLDAIGETLGRLADELSAVGSVRELVSGLVATARRFLPGATPLPAHRNPSPPNTPTPNIPPAAPARDVSGRGQLSGPERKILDAYAWWHSLGVANPGRNNVAPLAGYSNTTSKGFVNPLSSCRVAGLIEADALTQRGRELAEWPAAVSSLEEYHAKLTGVMDGPTRKIFDALASAGGSSTREALASATGYGNVTSKGFVNPLSRLSAMGLLVAKDGQVKGTLLMYPAALMKN